MTLGSDVLKKAALSWFEQMLARDISSSQIQERLHRLNIAMVVARMSERLSELRLLQDIFFAEGDTSRFIGKLRNWLGAMKHSAADMERLSIPAALAALGVTLDNSVEEESRNENPEEKRIGRWLPITVTPVSSRYIAETWSSLSLKNEEFWVDIGSGEGETLSHIGSKNSQGKVVGIDLFSSDSLVRERQSQYPNLSKLPPNVQYLVVGPRCPYTFHVPVRRIEMLQGIARLMRRKLIDVVGRHTASVVSIVYPYYTEDRLGQKHHLMQLGTALRLLKSRGLCFLVTENNDALKEALQYLEKKRWSVREIFYTPNPLGRAQLKLMGIQPYTPSKREVRYPAADVKEESEPFFPFNWGFVLLFTRR